MLAHIHFLGVFSKLSFSRVCRFSSFFFLVFGAKLQDPVATGLLVVVEHGFGRPLLHICFVSLNPSLSLNLSALCLL